MLVRARDFSVVSGALYIGESGDVGEVGDEAVLSVSWDGRPPSTSLAVTLRASAESMLEVCPVMLVFYECNPAMLYISGVPASALQLVVNFL